MHCSLAHQHQLCHACGSQRLDASVLSLVAVSCIAPSAPLFSQKFLSDLFHVFHVHNIPSRYFSQRDTAGQLHRLVQGLQRQPSTINLVSIMLISSHCKQTRWSKQQDCLPRVVRYVVQAPDFSLQNSEGKTVKLSSFAGSFLGLGAKPVVGAKLGFPNAWPLDCAVVTLRAVL